MDATRDHFGRGKHRPRFLKTHPRFLLSFHLLGFLACAPKTLHGYKRNQATIHPSFHDLAPWYWIIGGNYSFFSSEYKNVREKKLEELFKKSSVVVFKINTLFLERESLRSILEHEGICRGFEGPFVRFCQVSARPWTKLDSWNRGGDRRCPLGRWLPALRAKFYPPLFLSPGTSWNGHLAR